MRLAKLTLTGFKSFAEKTEFFFDAPVTGIVGPNGCGKSNVVDAIKWVLGERSAKSLRGKEMMDVIFAGSAGRKPAGMASVVLTFDNPVMTEEAWRAMERQRTTIDLQDEALDDDGVSHVIERAGAREHRRALAIDSEQVDVERRLFRDGTSQYLINDRRVRLRDIRELFMDTGVGAHAYSIIEQGKVDAMLLANPVERRVFFEEAAGIARFKARRVESMRKLERAETNLVRVREQLDSTERRLRIVRGQANRARTFKTLDAQLRGLRTALAFHQHAELLQRLAALTSNLSRLRDDRAEAQHAIDRLAEERSGIASERASLEEDVRRQRERRLEHEHAMGGANQRREMTERAIDAEREGEASDRTKAASLRARSEALQIETEGRSGEAETLAADLAKSERALEEAIEVRREASDALTRLRHEVSRVGAQSGTLEREIAQCESRAKGESDRAEHLAAHADAIDQKRAAMDRQTADVREELARATSVREETLKDAHGLDGSIEQLLTSSDAIGAEQRALADVLREKAHERARLESRATTLEEMAEARIGLTESVKRVLSQGEEERARGAHDALCARIKAPLANLIEVHAEDAAAMEAALGPMLQALVIDRIDMRIDGPALAELPGRVTLLPLEHTASARAIDTLSLVRDSGGRVTCLADRVRCADWLRPTIERLLAHTLLVPDLDAGALLAMGPLRGTGARFITYAGEALESDGCVVAGALRHSAQDEGVGLLQRSAELAALNELIDMIGEEIDSHEAQARELDDSAASLSDRLATLRREQSERQRDLVIQESACERLHAEIARLDRERPVLEREGEETREKSRTARDASETMLARLAGMREQADALAREHGLLTRSLDEAGERADEAGDRLTTLRVESSQHAERLASVRRELRQLDRSRSEAEHEIGELDRQIGERAARIEDHLRTISSATDDSKRAQQELERTNARLEELDGRLGALVEIEGEINDRCERAERRATGLDESFRAIELSKRELEVRRENLEERSLEELALDLAMECGAYRQLMREGDVVPVDPDSVAEEIDTLRQAIRKLGNINLDAIDEEANLEERNEDLIAQVADIDRARTHLEELIARLSDVSRDRFKTTFERIESHFGGKDGLFRKLFGGGRAELRLIPDPETGEVDWLESGIEVLAKPPGKEPRSISQLSGGEKTMGAVALLLSIFKSKPSPFCVLDEVDAALDDANVDRFGTIISRFTDGCDFIVITHNKRTMRVCDQLFGVTMQERGVSTRVRVRFEDVGAKGQVPANARSSVEVKPAAPHPLPA